MPSGDSGTPLIRTLGIGPGARVLLLGAPTGFSSLLEPLPHGVRFSTRVSPAIAMAHVLVTDEGAQPRRVAAVSIFPSADTPALASWPKKSPGVPGTVNEDVIRAVALPPGYVDAKVCAVTDVWSALKLVVRKPQRPRVASETS